MREEDEMGDVLDATEAAIKAAAHLTKMDVGALAAIRALALKIDMADAYFEELAEVARERKLRPPSVDNVSIPTYLKFSESLGLTPAGRRGLAEKKPEAKPGGNLASVSKIPRPASS